MINKKFVYFMVLAVAISSLMIPGCITPPQQSNESVQTTKGTVSSTANPDKMNSMDSAKTYIDEVIARMNGSSNSSSYALIYVSSGPGITLVVPLMLDENGEILKMYEKPIVNGNLSTSIVNTEYGKALRINGSGGEIKMIQDYGIPGSVDNEYRFLQGFSITMSNNTVIGMDVPFSYETLAYSETDVKDFRLFLSRSSGQSGKIIYIRTGNQGPGYETSIRLAKGWQYIKLYGDTISVK